MGKLRLSKLSDLPSVPGQSRGCVSPTQSLFVPALAPDLPVGCCLENVML